MKGSAVRIENRGARRSSACGAATAACPGGKAAFRCLVAICLLLLFPFPLPRAETDVILRGAGATFPFPLYAKWIDRYQLLTGVRLSYDPVGSGAGINQLISREIDFGGTDAFLVDEELRRASAEILHIPTCVGAVAIVYHLPVEGDLRLTPELIADIFLDRITNWSDKRLAEVNENLKLPQMKITVVHRSESSGTTFIFTDYLSRASRQWRDEIGSAKTVRWPTGLGIEGNPGIAELVKKIPGSISYVELAYARQANLPTARLSNRSGNFIKPTPNSVSSAADVDIPYDARLLITDTPSPTGYPISAFSYFIFYKDQAYGQTSQAKAVSLARFLWWAVHEGQEHSEELNYSRLPEQAVKLAEGVIRSMNYNGKPIVDW